MSAETSPKGAGGIREVGGSRGMHACLPGREQGPLSTDRSRLWSLGAFGSALSPGASILGLSGLYPGGERKSQDPHSRKFRWETGRVLEEGGYSGQEVGEGRNTGTEQTPLHVDTWLLP